MRDRERREGCVRSKERGIRSSLYRCSVAKRLILVLFSTIYFTPGSLQTRVSPQSHPV